MESAPRPTDRWYCDLMISHDSPFDRSHLLTGVTCGSAMKVTSRILDGGLYSEDWEALQ